MADKPETSSEEKDKTPPKWEAAETPKPGEYPNRWTHKTRSGHSFTLDDTKDKENVILKHRSGSSFEFHPDGAVKFTSQNGIYNVVFGESRMKITGAYDITVEGGGSMRVDGDFNHTIMGDHNVTMNGNYNMVGKNANFALGGDMSMSAKNMTQKVEGSASIQSSKGGISLAAEKSVGIASRGDSVAIGASKNVGIMAKGGTLAMKAGESKMSMSSTGIKSSTTGKITSKASGNHESQAAQIKMNSGDPGDADDASQTTETTAVTEATESFGTFSTA